MPGVAEGKELTGISTGDDIPPQKRVEAFLGSWEEDDQVRNLWVYYYSYNRFSSNSFVVATLKFSSCKICTIFYEFEESSPAMFSLLAHSI